MDYFSNAFNTSNKIAAFMKGIQESYKKYVDESVKNFQESSKEMMDVVASGMPYANTDTSNAQEKVGEITEKMNCIMCKIMSKSSMQLSQLMYDMSDYFHSMGMTHKEHNASAKPKSATSAGGTSQKN